MPIYEYYCQANHRIYQFYAKTLAQGRIVPRCPDNPKFALEKMVSRFAVTGRGGEQQPEAGGQMAEGGTGDVAEDVRMEAAMGVMEREFSQVDENDPRAMGRMMRRMTELTGEKIPADMEEVVRKLEEGADPDSLEDELGGADGAEGGDPDDPYGGGPGGPPPRPDPREPRQRLKARRGPPMRDPKLYDYE